MDSLVGRALGPYELQTRLGGGGMGTVYRAMHQALQQPRAIKVLRPELATDTDVVERFRREAMIAAGLRHPNIVLIYDVAEHEDVHYMVMELLEGVSLRELVRSATPLPLDRAIRLLRPLAAALDYAHDRGIIHRDVKPGNVMIAPDDRVTLVDFGIARAAEASRLTRSGTVIGTAEYMAPESFTGAGTGQSADLYALGIVAFEVLTGRLPFTGNPTAVSYAQVNNPLPPVKAFRPDLPPSVDAALRRQTSKRPDERFPSALSFVEALTADADAEADVPTLDLGPRAEPPRPSAAPARPAGADLSAVPPPPVPRPSPPVAPGPGTIFGEAPVRPAPTHHQTPPEYAPPPVQAPPPATWAPAPSQSPGPPRSAVGRLAGYVLAVLALVIGGTFALCQDSNILPGVGAAPTATTVAARPTTAPAVSQPPPAPTSAPSPPAVAGQPFSPTAAPSVAPPTSAPASAPATAPAPTAPPTQAPAVAAVPSTAPPASPSPAAAFQVVLDERFADNQRGWPNNPNGTAWLEGGVYHLFAREPNRFVSVGAPGVAPLRDVEVSARFRTVGGPPGGGFGLIVRDQGPGPRDGANQGGRYYVLEAGEGRQFGIWRREQDRWVDLVVFTPNDAVRPPGETNELTARAIGTHLIFLINGTQVADVEDATVPEGGVGIYVAGDGNMVDAEQFTVRAPH